MLILFGMLDLFSFYRTYENGLSFLLTFLWTGDGALNGYTNILGLIMVLNAILTLSLIASGVLLMAGSRIGFLIYYFQLPVRLMFLTLTFGFLLRLPGLQIDSWTYKIVLALVVGLEVLRLIFSIRINKRYFALKGSPAQ